ncbi:MAG: hypothetical protein HY937_02685 [Nitrosomonadales bacterium]|nr:hypothetical protein [Nitrosomonadales bacterium]
MPLATGLTTDQCDIPWLHIDLSASRCEDGLGIVASDITGSGVVWGLGMLSGS